MIDTTQQSEVERVARAIATAEVFMPDEAPVIVGMKTIPTWQSRLPHARAAIAALRPKVSEAEVREVFLGVRGWLQSAPLESGYCCCGSPVERHGFGDGHSPVDELSYAAGMQVERIDALLARLNHGEKA